MTTPQNTYKRTNQKQVRDELILEHLGFVRHILGRLVTTLPQEVDQDNLEGAGILGLVEAAQQFDPTREVEFKTFAYRRIRGAIIDELRRNSPLPQKMLKQISLVRKACEQLPPPVSPEMIAAATKLSLTEVQKTIEAMRLGYVHSWDESQLSARQLEVSPLDGPEMRAQLHESQEQVAEAIQQLPERERLVLTLYYLEDLRLKEIGEILKLSESRVSRILNTAQFRAAQIINARDHNHRG